MCRPEHDGKMKRIAKILALPLLASSMAAVSGCDRGFNLEQFMQESDIGLSIKGNYILRYDPSDCQIGFNESRNEFWVTDDTMANYFILKCRSFPEAGETVKADLTYTTDDDLKVRSDLTFQVTEYDSSAETISLWSQAGRIGVIVKVLR